MSTRFILLRYGLVTDYVWSTDCDGTLNFRVVPYIFDGLCFFIGVA